MTRLIRMILGAGLILIGIVSLFFPFSPGSLFILAGLVVLGSKWAKTAFMKAHRKASKWFGPKAGKVFLFPIRMMRAAEKDYREDQDKRL